MDGAAIAATRGLETSGPGRADPLLERLAREMEEGARAPRQALAPDTAASASQTIRLGPLRLFTEVEGARPFILNLIDGDEVRPVGAVTGLLIDGIGALAWSLRLDESGALQAAASGSPFGVGSFAVAAMSRAEASPDFPGLLQVYVSDNPDAGPSIYATLASEMLTAALRWTVSADRQGVVLDTEARFRFRQDVAQLGIAPMRSMYLFGPANRGAFDDYRPRVHSSDGLSIVAAEGLRSWRSLTNPPSPANSYIAMRTPATFGLIQRNRDFEAYQDAVGRYDLRPSLVVEPQSDWGDGFVRLIEQPSTSEGEDNITAFWMPKANFAAGEHRDYAYRLKWGPPSDENGHAAVVAETRAGAGGVSGVDNAPTLRKFVVDFRGSSLRPDTLTSAIDAFVNLSRGSVIHTALSRVAGPETIRLVIDADIEGDDPVELRAYLIGNGRQLTETWLYQWRRP